MTDAPVPRCCHPIAYQWFLAALPNIESNQGLVRAAVAISRNCLHDANWDSVEAKLESLAQRVRHRVRSHSTQAILANLHEVLFEEEGFRGNTRDYYNPRNSFLPAVLDSRQGIPITLSLVYKAVSGRLGIPSRGLKCPGHFLVEVIAQDEQMIVDPFNRGIILTRAEARTRLQQQVSTPLPDSIDLFLPATHTEWIARMLRNLQGVFSMQHNASDLQSMVELERTLGL